MTRPVPSLAQPGRVLLLVAVAAGLNAGQASFLGSTGLCLGSFVVLPLVLALPGPWALAAAALAAAPMLAVPPGLVLLPMAVLEAGWLKLLGARLRNAALADLVFWAGIGLPLDLILSVRVGRSLMIEPTIWPIDHALSALAAVVLGEFVVRSTPFPRWLGVRPAVPESLRNLIFHWVFAMAALPLMVMVVGISAAVRRTLREAEADRLATVVETSGRHVVQYLEFHRAAVATAAELIAKRGMAPDPVIQETRLAHPTFVTMVVTDADGRVVAAAPDERRIIGSNVADRPYFTQVRKTRQPLVSNAFLGRGFGHDVLVAISAPLIDPEGRFAGVVEASVGVQRFGYAVRLMDVEPDINVIVADLAGRVITSDGAIGLKPLTRLADSPLRELADGDVSDFDLTASDGGLTHVSARAGTFASGFKVIAVRMTKAQLGMLVWIYSIVAAVVVVMIGGAVLVASLVSRQLALPLERFAQSAVDQAESGAVAEMTAPVGPVPREVGMVFIAFNRLATRIWEAHSRLLHVNAELDARVADRTRELQDARQRAEAANASKSRFVAMTGHEIRTPLNALIGLSETVAEDAPPGPMAERIQTIRRTSVRMLGIVNDLLDLSRVEAGRLELRPSTVEVGAMAREVIALFGEQARRQRLDLELQLDVPGTLWVRLDSDRLQQVLCNLVGNALKFTREGGVRLRVERVAATATDVTLRFAVIDTGPGIHPEEQSRMFEPYVQLPSGMAAPRGGTGLGLAISRRLVHLFGGELAVSSAPGAGAEFHFSASFPREAAAVAGEAARDPALPSLDVLIVDDNAANQEVLRAFLEKSCRELVCADSAREAIARLRERRFDVALIDLEMPGEGGDAVARALATAGAGMASRDCALIAVSAYTADERRAESLALGFCEFVPKPVNRRALLGVIAECAARRNRA